MEDLSAENERLKKEIEELKKLKQVKPKFKVSEKGGLSVYGYGRFPVTLYVDAWKDILSRKEEILAFIEENKDKFSKKEDKTPSPDDGEKKAGKKNETK